MEPVSLPQRRFHQALIVGLVVTFFILVSIGPDRQVGCRARADLTCQVATCVFLTPIRVVAVMIISTWLFWTLPIPLSHAYSLRLFRPPRPHRSPFFEL